MNSRHALQIARRYRVLIGIVAAVGLLGGAGYAIMTPPQFTSQSLVIVPPGNISTQVLIASSQPVISGAAQALGHGVSAQQLGQKISVQSATNNVLEIIASGSSAEQAENAANAVATEFVEYVGSNSSPVGKISAHILETAVSAAGTSLLQEMITNGIIGALAGALIGFIVALQIRRNDRRLRTRDEISNAIGVPVLAAVPVTAPRDAAGWRKLAEDYEPSPVHEWRLRRALERALAMGSSGRGPTEITMLSLSGDRKAVALGLQLAVVASSLGIPTALVVGHQQESEYAATLRSAFSGQSTAMSRSRENLLVIGHDYDSVPKPGAALTIIVAVVNSDSPQLPSSLQTGSTILGVSAGAVTADQLARAASAAVDTGSRITGIIVADPEPTDDTTGLLSSSSGQERIKEAMSTAHTGRGSRA
jgi:capsular polysaccharide biosynthesis protein